MKFNAFRSAGQGGMAFLLLASCSPQAAAPPPCAVVTAISPGGIATNPAATIPPAPLAPAIDPIPSSARYQNIQRNGLRFQGVSFDSRSHRLRVVDQADGPGSAFPDAAAVGKSRSALAVVNGGFLTPEGKPLGLVVAEGASTGSWNGASSLGSAFWCEDPQGHSSIRPRSSMTPQQAGAMRHLLQAGPRLIEGGQAVPGLSDQKTSARTLLLWDGGTRWWIGITSPTTLAHLANTLVSHPPTDWQPRSGLNLDGGRSSEIWVSSRLAGQSVHHRPIWNRPVRNFLMLSER